MYLGADLARDHQHASILAQRLCKSRRERWKELAEEDFGEAMHEYGSTTYLELLEGEQMEVRIIASSDVYSKAI